MTTFLLVAAVLVCALLALVLTANHRRSVDDSVGDLFDVSRYPPGTMEEESLATDEHPGRRWTDPAACPAPARPVFAHTAPPELHRSRIWIGVPELRGRLAAFSSLAGPAERRAMADLLAGTLRALGTEVGPAYTAWREGPVVYVSTLPGGLIGARTIGIGGTRPEVDTHWTPSGAQWGTISRAEYRASLAECRPDRGGVNLGRERALRILEQRGAPFDLPVTAGGESVGAECAWVPEDRDEAPAYGWSADPRLIGPHVMAWQPILHSPTCVAVVDHLVRGQWSDPALRMLRDAAEVLLPGRHAVTVIGHGVCRFTVYLGVFARHIPDDERRDTGDADRTLRLARAVLGHMRAAEEGILLDGPAPARGLARPRPWVSDRFTEVLAAMGTTEIISPTDRGDRTSGGVPVWLKLRQVDLSTQRIADEELFDSVELRTMGPSAYVARYEGTVPD